MSDFYAQYQSGQATHALSNLNARINKRQAKDARARGEIEAADARRGTRAAYGTARAAYAGQNVELESGTPLQVQEDIARVGEEEVTRIRNNAAREAWGYQTQKGLDRFSGNLAKQQASARMWASLMRDTYRQTGSY